MSDAETGRASAADREQWLRNLRRALRSGGWLYLTFGLARRSGACGQRGGSEVGLPVVDGEVVWDRPNGY
jgi:hypothetical protein